MRSETITIPYRPRPQQAVFHREAKRFSVSVWHRRSGKTVKAVNHLLRQILTCPLKRPQGAYIAPTYSQAKKIAWEYVKEYAGGLPGFRANESELRCDLPNGGRIWLLGAENPDSIRGIYLDHAVLDEAELMQPRLYPEVIRPLLADRRGGATWIGTPKGYNEFFRIYQTALSAMEAGDPDWYASMLKASESGLISPEEIEDSRRTMDDDEWEQEWECSFAAAIRGSYYGRLMKEADEEGRIGPVPWEPSLPVNTYWDLGMADSMVIWFSQIVGRDIHLIDYHEDSGEGIEHYAKVLQDKKYVYGEHWAPHDIRVREIGTGKSRAEVARGLGLNFKVAPKLKIEDGRQAVRVILPRCRFDREKCAYGVDALRQHRKVFNERTKTFGMQAQRDWTIHGADAFRTMAVSLRDRFEVPERKMGPRSFAEHLMEHFRSRNADEGRI